MDQILTLIINSLFPAPSDAGVRDNYLAIARETTQGQSADLEKSRDAAVVLLQHLRRKYAQQKTNPPALPVVVDTPVESSPDARDVLLDIFIRSARRPFDAIVTAKGRSGPDDPLLPFLLSPVFADHFIGILTSEFFPALLKSFRGILVQADDLPSGEREAFLISKLEGRKQQAFLLETWQMVWHDRIDEKKIPRKPEAQVGGIFKKMLGKMDSRQAPGRRELTLDQWQAKKIEIQAANKKAAGIWRDICRDSVDYLAPQDSDKNLLRDMYGRSAGGLEKQVTALYQIASQGGSAKAFETYVKGRNVDMSFLAATYRYPGLFLIPPQTDEENAIPSESFIKNVLKGYKESTRRQMFPLLYRYVLSDAG